MTPFTSGVEYPTLSLQRISLAVSVPHRLTLVSVLTSARLRGANSREAEAHRRLHRHG